MGRSSEFDPSRTAQAVFQAVNSRFPGKITPEQAAETTQDIAEGARILDFVSPLAINRLTNKALGRDS